MDQLSPWMRASGVPARTAKSLVASVRRPENVSAKRMSPVCTAVGIDWSTAFGCPPMIFEGAFAAVESSPQEGVDRIRNRAIVVEERMDPRLLQVRVR